MVMRVPVLLSLRVGVRVVVLPIFFLLVILAVLEQNRLTLGRKWLFLRRPVVLTLRAMAVPMPTSTSMAVPVLSRPTEQENAKKIEGKPPTAHVHHQHGLLHHYTLQHERVDTMMKKKKEAGKHHTHHCTR